MLPNLPRMLKFLIRTFLFVAILLSLISVDSARAGCGDYFSCRNEIDRVKKEISRLQGLEKTLANQIAYLDNQIYLTELEIQARQAEIDVLSVDIGDITTRLGRIAGFLAYQEEIFTVRARSAYSSDQLSSFDIVLGADDLDTAIRRIKYLRVLERQDVTALEQMRSTRMDFNEQKTVLENKKADVERLKAEVESYKKSLISQQNAKEQLLKETKGEEARYQSYLKQLEAELQSILAALRRGGTRIGEISSADVANRVPIGRQGNTGCTTWPGGYHTHYAVGVGPVGNATVNYFVNPCGFVGVSPSNNCYSSFWGNWWGTVVDGSYKSPGAFNNYLTQSAWSSPRSSHLALDVVNRDGSVYPSAAGTAYLVKDETWGSWCRTGKPYNGPAYGIVIDHKNGKKTIYWHIQP
ncbi:MAG: hypothetical protein Q8L46_01785 [candidate division WWE3 bacterium]|nr:hypothetical protein [candidate division WWE3 bacterium]